MQPILVMKFGGTSVATIDTMKTAAELIQQEIKNGYHVAVAISAMAGETNRLVKLIDEANSIYDTREYDAIVATGEQVSAGLMALVLHSMGIGARSWQGWQIPVQTDNSHAYARMMHINQENILECFKSKMVAICAGFQGLSPRNRITTLGRGGTDTSAVALAAALQAERCDIYTDVDGVYTADPRIVPAARRLNSIAHEEMLEMASSGAKVLQTRAVEVAMNHCVKLRVLSTFKPGPGTLIVKEEDMLEKMIVAGITRQSDEAKITLANVADRPGIAASIFGPLAQAGIIVDMIVQSVSVKEYTDMTFTIPRSEYARALHIIKENEPKIKYTQLLSDTNVAKISIVGVGMKSHAGVAQKMFQVLAEHNINIQVISTSEIKVSVLIDEKFSELAMRELHSAFGLDKE